MPHVERHVRVRLGRPGDRIRDNVVRTGLLTRELATLNVEGVGPQIVFVPGDFTLAHPKGLDFDAVLRLFVGLVPLFPRRTAHHKLAARNRHHVEVDVRPGNLLRVALHLLGNERVPGVGGRFDSLKRCGPANQQRHGGRENHSDLPQTKAGH